MENTTISITLPVSVRLIARSQGFNRVKIACILWICSHLQVNYAYCNRCSWGTVLTLTHGALEKTSNLLGVAQPQRLHTHLHLTIKLETIFVDEVDCCVVDEDVGPKGTVAVCKVKETPKVQYHLCCSSGCSRPFEKGASLSACEQSLVEPPYSVYGQIWLRPIWKWHSRIQWKQVEVQRITNLIWIAYFLFSESGETMQSGKLNLNVASLDFDNTSLKKKDSLPSYQSRSKNQMIGLMKNKNMLLVKSPINIRLFFWTISLPEQKGLINL